MTPRALARIFARERRRFGLPRIELQLDTRAPRSRRAMAYTDGDRVTFYTRALELAPANVRGLARHELAHALLVKGGRLGHTERDADRLVEAITGRAIRYDCRGVQTTARGRRPRPRGLR